MTTEDEIFVRQCQEAGERLTAILFAYPKSVSICVLPGLLAVVMKTFDMSREMVIAMLDSALEDIGNA